MKFEKQEIDLALEFETVSGESVRLEPGIIPSAFQTSEIINKWTLLEKANKDSETPDMLGVMASQMAMIYDNDKEWFLNNVEAPQLQEMLLYVSAELTQRKKKG